MHGFIVNRIPDILLADKMAVETALGQTCGVEYVADGGIVIAFHRKELQGIFNDISTGSDAFSGHNRFRQLTCSEE